ncbi:hypothetical protein BJ165DRAFT_1078709 [Panaeolus papilionaceus]|nr:hypothetical protein BJ165DRAFT_1078709 [Panaeolus papilionaceus]
MDHQFLDLWTDKPIIFVDTPGLCDKDKSDSQTRAQIQKWMKKNAVKTVDRLLYVDRISDNRAPRSKSNTIEVLEALCGKDAAGKTVVMTAMWDLMWNERLKTLANRRYDLLKNGYWKDYLEKGCQIGTFDNTFEAGWKILKMFGPPHHASALDITLQVIEAALGNPLAMSTNPHLAALLLKGKARIIEDMKMPYDETLEAKRPTHDGWLSKLKEITGAKSTEPQGLASYRTSSSQNGHHEGVITPVISTAILTECHDSPISSPLRQKAMTLQRQVLDERHWRSIFYDAGNKLSLITMDKIQPEDIVLVFEQWLGEQSPWINRIWQVVIYKHV